MTVSSDHFGTFILSMTYVVGRQHGELYEEAAKGQHVHSCYSHYI